MRKLSKRLPLFESNKVPFTKELGGTLLIVTDDERTYEVSRGSTGDIMVRPDKGVQPASSEEEEQFKLLYRNSGSYNR